MNKLGLGLTCATLILQMSTVKQEDDEMISKIHKIKTKSIFDI